MEANKYLCPSCGMTIPATSINFKTRQAHCDFCGQNVIFPKRNSTASPNAVIAINQSRDFFLSGDFKSAVSCAQTAVEMVPNHVAALYIIAYYKAYVAEVKNRASLDRLFYEILPDAEFEIEEEEIFKQLLIKTVIHSIAYEEQILDKFLCYDDRGELSEFVEQFAPYAIAKRNDVSLLSSKMFYIYKEISKKTSIPKTWYALYLSLTKNSNSPFSSDTFFLRTKTELFYREYLLPVGEIFENISDMTVKSKFIGVYKKLKEQYEQKMK